MEGILDLADAANRIGIDSRKVEILQAFARSAMLDPLADVRWEAIDDIRGNSASKINKRKELATVD